MKQIQKRRLNQIRIQQLLKTANVVPAVNQVEWVRHVRDMSDIWWLNLVRIHPYLIQEELVEYAKEKGIVITAYSPTGTLVVTSHSKYNSIFN